MVDSSVLVAALIDTGREGRWAEDILTSWTPYAPELAIVEAMNILRRLESARRISTLEANASVGDLVELDIELFPFTAFADRVWELRYTVTSYDAWYIAIAEALKLPLATLDRRLSRAKGPVCEFLTP